MKFSPVVAMVLALILMAAVGTLNPEITANAKEDDETDKGSEDGEDQERSSDSHEDDVNEQGGANNTQGSNKDEGDRNDEEKEHDNNASESESKVDVEDDGLEIRIDTSGLNLKNGNYDATLTCVEPAINMMIDNAFEVEGGKGKLEGDVKLDAGTYSDCQVQVQGSDVIMAVGSFTIVGEEDEETKVRQEDRKKDIVGNNDARETHDRHVNSQNASLGEYEPGTEYTLSATGIADNGTTIQPSNIDATLGVWMSVEHLVLFDVLGGTVTAGDQSYTIQLGYAVYSNGGDVLRLKALATDDATGNIVRLSLRGVGDGSTELPKESGQAITLAFDGNNGMMKNELDGWELTMEGYAEAT